MRLGQRSEICRAKMTTGDDAATPDIIVQMTTDNQRSEDATRPASSVREEATNSE